MFLYVSIFSIGAQVLIVEYGGSFTSTASLTWGQWGWTILCGFVSMIFGVGMRFIPVDEDPSTFFAQDDVDAPAKISVDDNLPQSEIEMKPTA